MATNRIRGFSGNSKIVLIKFNFTIVRQDLIHNGSILIFYIAFYL